eukprot:5444975-Amphidinium_carterae.2
MEGEWHRRDLGPRVTRYTFNDGYGPPPEWIRSRRSTNSDGEVIEETMFNFPLDWRQIYKPLDSKGMMITTTLYWKRPCPPLPPPPEDVPPPDKSDRAKPFGRRIDQFLLADGTIKTFSAPYLSMRPPWLTPHEYTLLSRAQQD